MKKRTFLLIELLLVVFFVSLISFFILRGYSNFVKVAHKKLLILRTLLLTEEGAYELILKERSLDSLKDLPQEYPLSDEKFIFSYQPTEQILGELWQYSSHTEHQGKYFKELDAILFLKYEEEEAEAP